MSNNLIIGLKINDKRFYGAVVPGFPLARLYVYLFLIRDWGVSLWLMAVLIVLWYMVLIRALRITPDFRLPY
jgi:hypothetical protein